jgi:hypothetical protein
VQRATTKDDVRITAFYSEEEKGVIDWTPVLPNRTPVRMLTVCSSNLGSSGNRVKGSDPFT